MHVENINTYLSMYNDVNDYEKLYRNLGLFEIKNYCIKERKFHQILSILNLVEHYGILQFCPGQEVPQRHQYIRQFVRLV